MNQSDTNEASAHDDDRIDLIRSSIEQLQHDLFLAKSEIKTAIRDVAINQNYFSDIFLKLRGDLSEFNERLHVIELRQQQQNSST